jgi:hypothetical protein
MKRIISTVSIPLIVAGCSSLPTSAPVPDNLKPGAGEAMLASWAARGVQIYECRAKSDSPSATEWAFVAPEAELLDSRGMVVGKHYAGPQWESLDGSKVAGQAKARAEAPLPGAIPWLLLSAKSVGPAGTLASVTSVQRIRTTGGIAPPASACTAQMLGQRARVAYTADYVFFTSRPGAYSLGRG